MAQEKPAAPPVIPPVPKEFKLLGKNYVTPDLVAKVTGRAKYAEDFRGEGMVFIKLMPSPRPHARVVSIDASAALAMPGVHAILTADDLPAPPPPPTPPAAPPAPAAQRLVCPRLAQQAQVLQPVPQPCGNWCVRPRLASSARRLLLQAPRLPPPHHRQRRRCPRNSR